MLTVVIPSKNINNLIPCLHSICKQDTGLRIIVIDDGLDLSQTPIPSWYAGSTIEIIEGEKPFVFSRNCNRGIREAGQHSDVILHNDDCLLESAGGFTRMAEAAAKVPGTGIVGAVTNLTGQPLQHANGRNELIEQQPAEMGLRAVEHIAFVSVLIPAATRAALKASSDPRITGGLLDERYCEGYGSEDRDYCMQVEAARLCVCVHDGCFVDHSQLHSTFRGDPAAPGDIWANHRVLNKKWGLPPNPADPLYARLMRERESLGHRFAGAIKDFLK